MNTEIHVGINGKEDKCSEIYTPKRRTYSRKKKDGNFTIAEAKKLTEFFGVSFEYLFKVDGEK